MAPAAWWWAPLPAWLGSSAAWFVALNAIVAVIGYLSSRGRPLCLSPRRGARVTRRASSAAVLQSLRSFSIFSFPSGCLPVPGLQPDASAAAAAAAACQETEEPGAPHTRLLPSPRVLAPPPAPSAEEVAVAAEEEEDGDDDPNAMSMDEAYALAVASRQRPEREREAEARRSEVDAKAEEFIRRFKEDLRVQRLNSIANYTQMLRQRELGAGRRRQDITRHIAD